MGELLRRLRTVPAATPSVMLIGHNPAIHELALRLAGTGDNLKQLKVKFPTGAMATLAVPGPWKDLGDEPADLLEFAVPRELSPPDGG
jgi:phosphohistidine phosphatase